LDPRAIVHGLLLAAAASVLACGSGGEATGPALAPTAAPAASTAAPAASTAVPAASTAAPAASTAAPPPEPVLDLDPGPALGLTADEGEILIRGDVLRGHAVGARVGPLLASWPGWRATFQAIARDPVTDLEWVDIVGPGDAKQGRMLARVTQGALAALDGRLVALQARSAEPANGHVEPGVEAAAARLDGALRVVFRVQAAMVAVTPSARGPASSHVLARSRLRDPATPPFEAVRADVPRPHELVRAVPDDVARMKAVVFALPSGDADASAEGECLSPEGANRSMTMLRETIARQNNAIVRMMTHGLLDAIAIDVQGSTLKLHLHATRDQLEAVIGLALAMVPPAAGP
jgi:hypothetical protein